MSATSQKKVNFHFVTGNPTSEHEKRNVRTIVRSNASNRRWRLVREAAESSKGKANTSNFLQSPAQFRILGGSSAQDDKQNVDSGDAKKEAKKQRLADKQSRRLDRASQSRHDGRPENPVRPVNLTQHYFGNIPSSEVSKQSITRMLQGTAAAYTQLFPPGKNSTVSPMARDWFQQCFQTRGLLHTMVYCQAVRAQAIRPGWSAMPSNELVLCQTEALHAINDKLSQTETACDDESVRIVFSLTWHGTVKRDAPKKTPKQAPLADLQSLRMFMGIINCDPVHAQGLVNMLKLRGGLDKVIMPGLEFLVSYGDVLTASCFLTRPIWKYGSYAQYSTDAVLNEDWLKSTTRADHPLRQLGDGFSALHLWLPYQRAAKLQRVLGNMADYIRASHDYILGNPQDRNNAMMADQRNSIQHSLMSLRLDDDDEFAERELFELCWWAVVAYSLIAVFPLAPNAARFDRLSHLIRENLASPTFQHHCPQARDMSLWVISVGSLCAIGTPDREFYVGLLRQHADNAAIHTWYELRNRLLEFLWFPIASDSDGEELWAEVEQLGRITVWSSPDGE